MIFLKETFRIVHASPNLVIQHPVPHSTPPCASLGLLPIPIPDPGIPSPLSILTGLPSRDISPTWIIQNVFASGFFHLAYDFEGQLYCSKEQNLVPLYQPVAFHCIEVAPVVYSFTSWRPCGRFSLSDTCESGY